MAGKAEKDLIEKEIRLLQERGCPPYLLPKEIAQWLGISHRTIGRMMAKHGAKKLAGGRYSIIQVVEAMHHQENAF